MPYQSRLLAHHHSGKEGKKATNHVFPDGNEDVGLGELRQNTHVDSRIGDDLLLDTKVRVSSLQFGIGELSSNMKISNRDCGSYRLIVISPTYFFTVGLEEELTFGERPTEGTDHLTNSKTRQPHHFAHQGGGRTDARMKIIPP